MHMHTNTHTHTHTYMHAQPGTHQASVLTVTTELKHSPL
jgi:hypothetical protein